MSFVNSPSATCDVAVAALAQAIAVPLSQTHRFSWVVTAQQRLQSGEAAAGTDQTHHNLIIIIHTGLRIHRYESVHLGDIITALPQAILHIQRLPHERET